MQPLTGTGGYRTARRQHREIKPFCSAVVASKQGAVGTQDSCQCRLRTGSHPEQSPPRWHHTKGSPPGGEPSPPAPCSWGGGWPLRMILERKPELENPIHQPGRTTKEHRVPSDWSRPARNQARWGGPQCVHMILDSLVQEFLLGGDAPWAGDRMEDNSQQTSTPEPSPQSTSEWIGRFEQQVNILVLVVGTLESSQSQWSLGICQKGESVIPTTKGELPCCHWDGEWLLHAASTPLPGSGLLPAHPGHQVQRPGLPAEAATEDPGLHKGPPVLGRKSPAPTPRQTLHWLAESVLEVWWEMEPLVTFMDEEVLEDLQPSHWVQITPSSSAEPTLRECSCSRTS